MQKELVNVGFSEKLLQTLLEDNNNAIIILDSSKCFVYVNPTFETLYGWNKKEVSGLFFSSVPLIPSLSHEEVESIFNRVESHEQSETREAVHTNKAGDSLVVKVTATAIRNEEGLLTAYSLIVRDVSEELKLKEKFEHLNRKNEMSTLAAGIAHEIRNPLTSINGFVQMMVSGFKDDRFYNIILEETKRINKILEDLLSMTKPLKEKFRCLEINKLVDQVCDLIEGQAFINNIDIKRLYKKRFYKVNGNDVKLKQVILNYIKNAIEAMPNGGFINIKINKEKSHVVITIIDSGKGIPKDLKKSLGTPFFTTKENGTGLGLMVSANIINEHKGFIKINSKENIGTTVKIYLKLVD